MPEPDMVLDVSVLEELADAVGGDRPFVVDLVETFIADGEQQLTEIATALAAGDAAAVVRPAHTLKSSSATVGAPALAAAARAIELAGRAGNLEAVAGDAEMRILRETWDDATRELRAWVAGEIA